MITSASNAKIKTLSALLKKSKERKKEHAFVAEGIKMFLEAPKEQVLSIYVSESFTGQKDHEFLLDGYDYEVVFDSVFRAVSDTQTPQGIITVLKMPDYTLEQMFCSERTHLLVLESIQDPGNLGTMLRTGEGAGITGVIMNRTTVDLFNPKTIRATMGSIYRVPYLVTDNIEETILTLKENGVSCYAAHLNAKAGYDAFDYKKPTAFLIGNEGNGLSSRVAELADACIGIPMEGKVESLNAAVSAAVLMYECSRQRRKE